MITSSLSYPPPIRHTLYVHTQSSCYNYKIYFSELVFSTKACVGTMNLEMASICQISEIKRG